MPRNERTNWTPLPDARTDRVTFNIPLPSYVPVEQLGVNLLRIEKMMDWGGIERLTVTGKSGETSVSVPVAVGMNKDGSLTAGKSSSLIKVEPYKVVGSHDLPDSRYRNSQWNSCLIILNLSEIVQRINLANKSVRSLPPWADHLDEHVRKAIRRTGTTHMLTGLTRSQKITALTANFHKILPVLASMETSPTSLVTTKAIGVALFYYLLIIGGGKAAAALGQSDPYRMTLFPGYEIDRAAVFQLLTRALPVIKFIETP